MSNDINIKVLKRDGREENFNSNKITNAIIKAVNKVNRTIDFNEVTNITNNIVDQIYLNNKDNTISIYDIEKITEYNLMQFDKEVAREYIGYRNARNYSRTKSSNLVKKINGLFDYNNMEVIAENANKDATKLHIQRDLLAGIVSKDITMDLHYLPKNVEKYMNENYIHFHNKIVALYSDVYRKSY